MKIQDLLYSTDYINNIYYRYKMFSLFNLSGYSDYEIRIICISINQFSNEPFLSNFKNICQ